ncbi:penicillin-binding protein [Bacillus velezensis]|uniref:penicillin-binding protein 2B n=1 Tax=Bacillus amyloliquefaciens group TaxID=1938374 RepID=UPI001374A828|nr:MULTISPECIES: penicillin-binding protein 2B [Bacillus amyloliquefaciens group]MCT6828977.1 penicillin-binding protein 2B [Bacillus velezensis]MCT6862417.1 penicillin-binding protein 2B [Bacillus velezensis]QOX76969.1 penicillin-binding protein [Bacillus velezensis]QVV95289.1 penicillin-binding protein 2B [Bacillus amyloliquefaciens]QYR13925.1 penicillin-binding protein [Bacillus velezensis]
MPKKNKFMNRGAAILSICFALFFFVILGRMAYIQLTGKANGVELATKATEQHEKKRTIEASRGSILDRNGKVLAEDTATYKLIAVLDKKMTSDPKHPQHVKDKEKTAEKLATVINLDKSEILDILNRNGAKQVEFGSAGRDISYAKKQKIEKMGLPGISFLRDTKRYYPNGIFLSNVLGYADVNEKTNEIQGSLGLEKILNNYLTERDGSVTYESDKSGWKLPNSKEKITAPKNGDNVYLTIDQKIQTFLEDSMTKVAEKYKPKKIMAAVVEPKTGKVLAMGQRPSFDPNIRNVTNYYNDLVSYAYEPGSTMKIFTLAAAIQENVFSANEKYKSGTYKVGGGPVKDWNDGAGWGMTSFHDGLMRSSNVAFAKLANEKLGFDRFNEYLHKFGLYQKTGIDLPGEVSSKINYKYDFDKASTAYGQASAITPIQQLQAVTAIANNGKMMKPYVIDHIVDPDTKKVVKQTKPEQVGTPISADTAKKVRNLLGEVVTSDIGTGKPYKIEGFDVAGKTGTAQIAGTGGYLRGTSNYVFSFMGMAPKNDPKLVIYVAVQQPQLKAGQSSSDPVAEIFNPTMKNSLHYMNIEPTEKTDSGQEETKSQKMPDLTDKTVTGAEKEAKNEHLTPIVIGSDVAVKDQYPTAGEDVITNQKIFLKTDGKMTMPDMSGWSRREVLQFSKVSGIHIDVSGEGYASSQSVKKGKELKENTVIKVKFKNPD